MSTPTLSGTSGSRRSWIIAGLALVVVVLAGLYYLWNPISVESAREVLNTRKPEKLVNGATVSFDFNNWDSTFTSDAAGVKPASEQDAVITVVRADNNNVLNVVGAGQIFTKKEFSVDTSKSYEMAIRVRVLPADDGSEVSNRIFAGLATFDEDGKLETTTGATHRYGVTQATLSSNDGWQDYLGIFTGTEVSASNPKAFRPTTKTVRPVVIFNTDKNTRSTMQIESITFRQP